MKKLIQITFIAVFLFLFTNLSAQVFWTETFGMTGCTGAQLPYTGTNGQWTAVSTGTNDPQANVWYRSDEENGEPAGTCGQGCSTKNTTLHIGPHDGVVADDGGAHYDAGGLCGTFFNICVTTNVRAESPIINCTGKTNITLSFNYIENGQGNLDNATLCYSANGGATWISVNTPKTTVCGSGQGLWTAYSQILPASANNNPNVKIGFNWTNNDDATGTDPSFAVDDITLSAPVPTAVELKDFNAVQSGKNVNVEWVTLSEKDNSHFVVERATDATPENFTPIGTVKGMGTTTKPVNYLFTDKNPVLGANYYRLKTVDNNGLAAYSKTAAANFYDENSYLKIVPNPAQGSFNIIFMTGKITNYKIEIVNMFGQAVFKKEMQATKGYNKINLSPTLAAGIYEVRLTGNETQLIGKLVVNK